MWSLLSCIPPHFSAQNVTVEEIITAYKQACQKLNCKQLPKLLKQIQVCACPVYHINIRFDWWSQRFFFITLEKLAASGTEPTNNNRETCSRNVILSLSCDWVMCVPAGYFYGQQIFQVIHQKRARGDNQNSQRWLCNPERESWFRPNDSRECGSSERNDSFLVELHPQVSVPFPWLWHPRGVRLKNVNFHLYQYCLLWQWPSLVSGQRFCYPLTVSSKPVPYHWIQGLPKQ